MSYPEANTTMLAYKRKLTTRNFTHTVVRGLPRTARPLVRVGQTVLPYEIVGVGEKSAGFRSLNLAELLKVKPERVGQFLLKNKGSFIYKGEVLAKKKEYLGMREIEIHSPMDGVVADINEQSGVVSLEYLPKKVKVPAGVSGQVVEISESKVKIRTQVTKVQGVIGSGRLKEGVIKVINNWELPLRADQITPDLTGKIIVGGSQVGKEVLYKCLALQVAGVVSGGINFADFQDLVGPRGPLEDVGVGLLVLSGFGNFPIGSLEEAFFKEYDQRPALLYGGKTFLLFPEFKESQEDKDYKKARPVAVRINGMAGFGVLKVGRKVRLLNMDHLGLFGIIKKLGSEERELPSGIKEKVVVVELEDGREIEAGARNVELVEY